MKCPRNPLSPEEWLEYIEGSPSRRDCDRIDVHIERCEECAAVGRQLRESRAKLIEAAQAESASVSSRSLARLWDNVRFRIRRAAGDVPSAAPAMDLTQLRSILISMCGEGTAEGALNNATPGDARFAENLGSIVEAMCGKRAARFVEHAAQAARQDRVA